ncbi:MAG: ATP-dependent helicase [Patescibacteria group bacterium]
MTINKSPNSQFLIDLNPEQKKAVLCLSGPLLIIAGAGAGKTKTLTSRIGYLMESGLPPENILAVTFTNKAAQEMKERVGLKTKHSFKTEPQIGTFHSLGLKLLKQYGQVIDLPSFAIIDRYDQTKIIKEVFTQVGYDPKQIEPKKALNIISRQKGDNKSFQDLNNLDMSDRWRTILEKVWPLYDKKLKQNRFLDFDDLLIKPLKLLKQNSDILKTCQEKFKYIHIDEYQDTNTIQYELSKILTGDEQNICVVGDQDQAIYGWRGADDRNILKFRQDFPQHKLIILNRNYRSSGNILAAANQVIEKNPEREPKNLITDKEAGSPIRLLSALDGSTEAETVAQEVSILLNQNHKPEEIAILFRTNFQSRLLEEAFNKNNIPYQVVGTKFFDRKEIKDLTAFVRVAFNQTDLISLARILSVPKKRGIGKITFNHWVNNQTDKLSTGAQTKIKNFQILLNDLKEKIYQKPASEALLYIVKQTGWEQECKKQGEIGLSVLANLNEFIGLADAYNHLPPPEGLQTMMLEKALMSDQDNLKTEPASGVKLMTVHAAKGLEFKTVFVVGLEQELFPLVSPFDQSKNINEERRLFYVAMTRARENLILSYAQIRNVFGQQKINQPSEFLLDIEEDLLATDQEVNSHSGYLDEFLTDIRYE